MTVGKSASPQRSNKSTKQKGDDYECLVQQIYERILNQDSVKNVNVQRKAILQGLTGNTHEIDVYWEFEQAGITYRACVQAKNYASRISQEKLFAFHKILEDIPGQPRGIFITRTGYQKGALRYAEAHDIVIYKLGGVPDYTDNELTQKLPESLRGILLSYNFEVKFGWDRTWLKSQRIKEVDLQRLSYIVNLQIQKTDNVLFFDESGIPFTSFKTVRDFLYPPPPQEDPQGKLYVFDKPTFVNTGDPRFPQLKVNKIIMSAVEVERRDWFQVSAKDVVKAIMTNALTGEQWLFNNEFQRDGTFTFTVRFPEDFRKTN